MRSQINSAAFRAFEERHSRSLNRGSSAPEIPLYARQQIKPKLERATDFLGTEGINDVQPTDAAMLVMLTDLALHLVRARTNPYRVRRESLSKSKGLDHFYVPRIDYEAHFSALRIWLKRYSRFPALLREGSALHPVTRALIEAAQNVAQGRGKLLANSREEYEWLDDMQLECNVIAERMRAWFNYSANATLAKAWEKRLATVKEDFMARGRVAAAAVSPMQLLRFDLLYAGQVGNQGFGAIGVDVVKSNVALLYKKIQSSPRFSGHLTEFHPYADFTVTWIVHGVVLVPVSATSISSLIEEIRSIWNSVVAPHAGVYQDNYSTLQGDFRYVAEEQRMLDPLWLQLSRAQTYIFDTRLIMDTSLEVIAIPTGVATINLKEEKSIEPHVEFSTTDQLEVKNIIESDVDEKSNPIDEVVLGTNQKNSVSSESLSAKINYLNNIFIDYDSESELEMDHPLVFESKDQKSDDSEAV